MAWFKRKEKGINTPTEAKKDTPKGLWYKTPSGKIIDTEELKRNLYVSPEDGYHVRVGSKEYFEMLFDDNKFKELNSKITAKDPLKFEDTKKYPDRLKAAQEKTNLKDAVRTAVGKSLGKDIVIAAMDFSFIGGSMGSVVGEKIARAIEYSIQKNLPFLMISKSGGARMMEASLSLMQLVKTSAKLAQLAEAKIPYISLCTDPTTGGTTASFAKIEFVISHIFPASTNKAPFKLPNMSNLYSTLVKNFKLPILYSKPEFLFPGPKSYVCHALISFDPPAK